MQTRSLGKHNPKLVDLRKAIKSGALTHDGLLPIEGPKLLDEACRSGVEIVRLFVRNDVPLRWPLDEGKVFRVDPTVFGTIQGTETSQGVIALVQPRHFEMHDLLSSENPLLVILARLQDPGNSGAILRAAESFGATGCLSTEGGAGIFQSKTVRASTGSIFRLPHVWDADLRSTVAALKSSQIRIAGTAPTATQTIDQWDWRKPCAIMIGNEGSGLSIDELAVCDAVVRIPHKASVQSLNSSIAAAIILYEAFNQRRNPNERHTF